MQRLELLDRTAPVVVGNKMPKLAKDVPANLDQALVAGGHAQMLEHGTSGIWLQVFVVGDELHDAVPDLGADVIPGSRDELEDNVDIPLVLKRGGLVSNHRKASMCSRTHLGSKALGEDRNLEHHLLPQVVVGRLQVL